MMKSIHGRGKPVALAAFILLTRPASAQQLIWTEYGPAAGSRFGDNVEGMPDLDGDGWPDFMVAAAGYDGSKGAVFLYSGRSGTLVQTFVGEKIGDNLMTMSAVGDVTGDGIPEFLLGAVNGSHNNTQSGRVYLYDGATLQILHRWDGEDQTNRYAWVEGTGDLDGDGWPDYFITAPFYTWWSPLNLKGKVYAYSGRTHAELYAILGEDEYDGLTVLSHLGDIDGDDVPDFLAGSAWHDSIGTKSGRAYVCSGRTGQVIYHRDGQSTGDQFGFSGDVVGDVDRDGRPDFAVGAPYRGSGAVCVFSGATGGLLYQWASDGTVSEFGREVAGGADVNGDGWPDVAVGSGIGNPTAVFLYSGRTGTLLYRFAAPQWDGIGWQLSFVGDVTGDGIPELLAGQGPGIVHGQPYGQVWLFAGNDLYLQATFKPRRQRLVLETRGGPPSAPAFVSWRLRPTDLWSGIQVGRLNKNGEWKATLEVPPSLFGLTIECQSFARSDRATGDRWMDSAVTEVVLQ